MVDPMEVDGVPLWQEEAKCVNVEPTIFFNDDVKDKAYKAFCSACPVLNECLEYALLYNLQGVWGGTTYRERCKMSKISVEMLRDDMKESGLYNYSLKV